MVAKKKSVKKKVAKKKINHKTHAEEKPITPKENRTERALIENFVSLQKVMTNLSVKFDGLTSQISKLLELFEISAKSLAEKDTGTEKANKDTKILLEKMDNMFDQNKTLAQGLTMMHDRIEDRGHDSPPYETPKAFPKPIQRMPPRPMSGQVPKQEIRQDSSKAEYKKSISSKSPEFT